MNKTLLWIGILIVVVVGIYWASNTATAPEDGMEPVTAEGTEPTLLENFMALGDQKSGFEIVVPTVTLSEGGTIVVHKDVDGEASDVIGTLTLGTGSFTDSRVTLSEAVASGDYVHVMLHADLNKDGAYSEMEEGSVLMDAAKQPISVRVAVK